MKKSLLFLTLPLFLFASCSNTETEKVEQNHVASYLKPRNVVNVIEGEANYEVVSGGVLLHAPGTLKFKDVEYVFGYFGLSESKPLDDTDSPTYKYNSLILDEYSYLLNDNPVIKAESIKPYYVLKKYFYFKGYKKEAGRIEALDVQDKDIQPFYTDLDHETIIPSVKFDNKYTYLDYFTDETFSTPITTFGDLEERTKASFTYPYIYSLYTNPYDMLLADSFNYFDIYSLFGISGHLKKYTLTADKEVYYNDASLLRDATTITTDLYSVTYSSLDEAICIKFNKRIKNNPNNYIVPRDVDTINFTTISRLLFVENFSFRALFELSEATIIDITNTSPLLLRDMSHMFSNCINLKEVIGLSTIDTSYVRDMSYMFYNANNLKLDQLFNFDTSNVTNMSYMFAYANLSDLDISSFNTSRVNSFKYMFSGASNFVSIPVSDFDFTSASDVRGMFSNISSIDYLDVNLDLSGITFFDSFVANTNINVFNFGSIFNNDNLSIDNLLKNSSIINLSLIDYKYLDFLPVYDQLIQSDYTFKVENLALDTFDMNVDNDTYLLNERPQFIKKLTELPFFNKLTVKNLTSSVVGSTLAGMFEGVNFDKVNADFSTWDLNNVADFSNLFKDITYTSHLVINLDSTHLDNAKNFDDFLSTSTIKYPFKVSLILGDQSISGDSKPKLTSTTNFLANRALGTLKLEPLDFTEVPSASVKSLGFYDIEHFYLPRIDFEDFSLLSDLLRYRTRQMVFANLKTFIANDFAQVKNSGSQFVLFGTFSNFYRVEKFKATNIDVSFYNSLKAIRHTFKNFQNYLDLNSTDIDIDVSGWTFKALDAEHEFEFLSTFQNSDLAFFNADNWVLEGEHFTLSGAFKNINLYSESVAWKKQLFDFSTWSGSRSNEAPISFKTSSNLDDFQNINNFLEPGGQHADLNYNLITKTFLNLDNVILPPGYKEGLDPDTGLFQGSYIGSLSFNNHKMSDYNHLATMVETSASELTYERTEKPRILRSLSLDNIDVDVNISYITQTRGVFFSRITKSITDESNLSYKNWKFVSLDQYYINDLFSECDYVLSDVSTFDLKNVISFDHLFYKSTLTNPITLNIVQDIDAGRLFRSAIIKDLPKINKLDPNANFSGFSVGFYRAVSYVPLDLTGAGYELKPKSITDLFSDFSFDSSVSDDDRRINIGGNGNTKAWDLTAVSGPIDLFDWHITNTIVHFDFPYCDIVSYNRIKEHLTGLSLDDEYGGVNFKYLDLSHMYVTGTASTTEGNQYRFLRGYRETTDPNDFIIYLDHITFADNSNSLFEAFTYSGFYLSNFDTSTIVAKNIVDFNSAFCNVSSFLNNTLDLSSLEFTISSSGISFKQFLYLEPRFKPFSFTTLITKGLHISKFSSLSNAFFGSEFTVWIFDYMVIDERYTGVSDPWWMSAYGKKYSTPEYDNMYPVNFPRPWDKQ